MRLQIGNPKPIPLALVVKNGIQILSKTSLVMPAPLSEILNAIVSPQYLGGYGEFAAFRHRLNRVL